jgi:hypothetical protein
MSHNLFGERFLGHREPGWHHLGEVFQDPITAAEAIRRCQMDYEVLKVPMTVDVPTPFGINRVVIQDKVVLLREPTPDDPEHLYLGVASPDYEIVQNTDVAEALDQLTDVWPVETMGALDKGKTMFASLDAGMTRVAGEEVHQYFLATNTNDGGTSMKIMFTPVRVVCQNTLVTGMASATVSAALNHKTGVIGSMKARMDMIKKLQQASATTLESFEKLAKCALDETGTRQVLEFTYPYPKRPSKVTSLEGIDEKDIALVGALYVEANAANELWQYYCERADAFRSGAVELFNKINDEHPAIAGSAYALFNAVVESADYRAGSDSVISSSIFGARAQEKKRAFKAAMDLVK